MDDEAIGSEAFREALSHFASGVTVVAAHGSKGPVGFTATGFTSVSLRPPLVLVCVGRFASVHDELVAAARFGVSILAERQAALAQQFARSRADRFGGVPLRPAPVPLVEGAVAWLQCMRHGIHLAGDHSMLIGTVVDCQIGRGRPLVHCARRFGGFAAEGVALQAPPPRGGGA